MNATDLLAMIARLGDEPEQMLQLRKLIVALAISGRLSEQSIGAASLTEGSLPPTPEGHRGKFVKLATIASIEKGRTGIKQAKPGPYPLVVTSSARASCEHFDFDGCAAIVPLVSSSGHGKATINRLHYAEGRFALGTILAAIIPHDPKLISARFLFEYLSAFKDELLVSRMIGTANVSLSVGKIAEVPVPVVEFSVQRRVDELMALCDQLEAARAEREVARDRMAAASLARLNAPDQDTFQADARFALNVLPALTARPDQVKQLRQTILSLAVRGRLVAQDVGEGTATELLRKIASQSASLINRGAGKRGISGLLSAMDQPFEVPGTWTWTNLNSISSYIQRGKSPTYATSDGALVVSQRCVQWNRLDLNVAKRVTLASLAKYEKERFLRDGDILWNSTGTGTIGRLILLRELADGLVCDSHVTVVRTFGVSPDYVVLWLRSDHVYGGIEERAAGSTNQVELTAQMARSQLVPLPPLAEQHRIVAKVDELMALCDQLEASLTVGESARSRLLEALLHEALESSASAAA
jgi:type I restriction enzyme S subunit